MLKNNYIFFTGAPGSTWSGIAKRVYWSPDIDHSDYIKGDREYFRGSEFPAHTGAYWDPGMEFEIGDWDKPFAGNGIKLIKSHSIAADLDRIKNEYPSSPIVMVWRDDDECNTWWHDAGGWDIYYPEYRPFYQDDITMKYQIAKQNIGMLNFVEANIDKITEVESPLEINKVLNIEPCPQFNPAYPKEDLHNVNSSKGWVGDNLRIFVYTP